MTQQENRRKSLSGVSFKIGAIGLMCLATILVMAGCNVRQSGQLPDKFWAGVRPASQDSERLLRNFRYLKAAGRTELALKEMETAHQQDPANLKIIDILAQCYEELGAWDRAENLYLEALARDRDNPALANNLCFSYYQAGKYDKAEACFRDLLKRHPENTTVRNNLGLLLAKTGRQEEAYRLWREHGDNTAARTRLDQALAALGLAPQINVARQADVDRSSKESVALSTKASPSSGPETQKRAAAEVPALPTKVSQQPAPGGTPAASHQAPETAVSSGRPEKPRQSASVGDPDKTEAVQAKGPSPLPSPQAAVKETPKQSPEPKSTTHLAMATEKAAVEVAAAESHTRTPGAQAVKAPVKPAASPSASEPQPAKAAVGSASSAAAGAQPPAKPESMAAPAAPAPAKPQVKDAVPKAPKPADVAAPLEPKRPDFLTSQELVNTRLEIKNGNGVKGIAALNRTWLTMEGFRVAAIGNHIDFGKKKTEISYRPEAERVALALKEDFFPQADLKPSGKLGKDTDVRITLGHDQKARKGQIQERIALLDLKAQLAVILASSDKAEPSPSAAAAKPARVQAPRTKLATAPPAPAPVSEVVTSQKVSLTAEELTKTKIELRNGNGVQDQARHLRSRLEVQGFNVVRIKNHIDFGMEQTKILCRPGSQRVARTLSQKYFRTARVEETANLPENVDVKVILGKDLSAGFDLLANLAR